MRISCLKLPNKCFIIHKEKSNKMQRCIKILLFHIYMKLNMFRATPSIIRSLKLHWQSLVFHTWKVVGRVVGGQRPPTSRPTAFHVWKTRDCQCSFRLLMMGGVSPETCWASYKYGIIKFWYIVASCWIFLYEFYYDALIHEVKSVFNCFRCQNYEPEFSKSVDIATLKTQSPDSLCDPHSHISLFIGTLFRLQQPQCDSPFM